MAVSGTTTSWNVDEINDDTNIDELKVFDSSTDTSHNVEHKPANGVERDIAIKWGMAFNNATRLVSSLPLHNDEGDLKSRVKVIKSIMPEMFSIACSMPAQKQVNEDDLPF